MNYFKPTNLKFRKFKLEKFFERDKLPTLTLLRCLLLERKVMTNLDSILKGRDIILLTKFCLVKATVFPVVMYRCESWTIKKTEH